MGWHTVTLGLPLVNHSRADDILKVIAEHYTVEGDPKDFLNLIYKIKLYPDIITDDGETEIDGGELCWSNNFVYVKNDNIRIGSPNTCVLMIYIGSASSDNEHNNPIDIDYDTINDLKEWQKELEEQGRTEEDLNLQMISNCCS